MHINPWQMDSQSSLQIDHRSTCYTITPNKVSPREECTRTYDRWTIPSIDHRSMLHHYTQ